MAKTPSLKASTRPLSISMLTVFQVRLGVA
jgi:hypothetical protein